MSNYHITQEQALEIWNKIPVHLTWAERAQDFANAVLDKVLGEPVGEVEVRKQRVLLDTFQQVTSPIQDGRHKLYAPRKLT